MKIPLQEKIAELEQRIVRLEEQAERASKTRIARTWNVITNGKGFGPHWRKMWEEFHLMMKEMFE